MPPSLKRKQRHSPLPHGALAQGGYRVVFVQSIPAFKGEPGFKWVEKRSHAEHESFSRGKIVRVPMSERVRKRFRAASTNQQEWENYRRFFSDMPAELRACVARPLGIAVHAKEDILYMELVKDQDGKPSKTLAQNGPVSNSHFWKKMDALMNWMRAKRLAHFDLNDANILVRKISPTEWIPVLVDLKSVNTRRLHFQPWLRLSVFANAKMMRSYTNLVRAYASSERNAQKGKDQ